jgi:tape measure domain-containing protein
MSAVARVAVELSTGAAQAAAKKLQAGVKRLEAAVARLKPAAERAQSAFKRMADAGKRGIGALASRVKAAAKNFGGLGKAAALAAAAAGAAAFARFAFGKAGQLEKQTKSLQVLTGSLGQAKAVISELQAFGAVTPFTSDELIETAKRLKAFGFETAQITDVTKRLADVAGATGADLGGIATAFGQIQAKGRLQTEELLQLQERGVGLGEELQKMYGMTGTEFSKALQKGQISAKAANVALNRLTEAGGKYANGAVAQSDTLFGKLSTLQDAFDQFGRNIGKVLTPIFKGIIDFLTTITNQINNLFTEADIAREVDKELGIGGVGAKKQFRGGGSVADRRAFQERRAALIEEKRKERAATSQTKVDLETPALLAGTTAAGGKSPAEILEEQRKASQQRIRDLQDQGALKAALNEEERRTVQLNLDLRDIIENTKGLKAEEVDAEIQARLAFEDKVLAAQKFKKDQEEAVAAQKKAAEETERQAQKLQQIYDSIGSSIADGVVNMLDAAVDKTKSLADAAANTLRNVGNILLKLGVNTLLKSTGLGIFANLQGFANGGRPPVGRPSLVGERGPELFVPRSSGTIVPNHALGGGANVTVNVDASGSSVEGNGNEASQLGKVLGLAVQQELIKQKRPGGLLAS